MSLVQRLRKLALQPRDTRCVRMCVCNVRHSLHFRDADFYRLLANFTPEAFANCCKENKTEGVCCGKRSRREIPRTRCIWAVIEDDWHLAQKRCETTVQQCSNFGMALLLKKDESFKGEGTECEEEIS
jgi:hypothetical protein